MGKMLRKPWILIVALAILGPLAYAFLPQAVPVELARAERGSLVVTIDEDGKTRVKERYVVSAALAGRLRRIELDPGDVVEAGRTALAVIEATDPALLDPRTRMETEARVRSAQATVQRAAAELEGARAAEKLAVSELERAKRLSETDVLSRQELDRIVERASAAKEEMQASKSGVDIARFELEQARAALLRTRPGSDDVSFEVRSPIDGRVLRVLEKSERVVTPGAPLLELGDPTELEAEIDVLSSDAVRIAPGARVVLGHWGGTRPLQGRVRRVEPGAFTKISALGVEEQRVNVIVDLDDGAWESLGLGDGYRVEARIVVWEGEDVLKVPSGVLFRDGEGWAVFRVSGSRARLRPVEIGESNGLEAEVLAGLEQGDSVILHPSDRVRDGARVSAR